MSYAVPPCPDVPAQAQYAAIRELIRIAELQEQVYAREAPGRRPGRPFRLRDSVPLARLPVNLETFTD
jgi:hypothetical protein